MDIVLEDMTVKAKIKLLERICDGLKEHVENTGRDETTLDVMLGGDENFTGLLNFLDDLDNEDFWGTEGWRRAFGISS